MRGAFAQTVFSLMREHEEAVLLIGDVGTYGLRDSFAEFPKRCFNLGPAEQCLAGIAAGFSKEGFYPIAHSFSSFLLRRAYEQIRLDLGEQKLPALLVGIFGYPKFGASHVCEEDAALMGGVPNMHVYTPIAASDVAPAMRHAVASKKLAYVRLT